ncbi:uncharacterized protein EV420DRAFT_1562331 [Desarmillaria tabescens]|uniref:RRM domain-containing protein n=1 Tax=Armillaria tabescens TaxID=1929756 RepID=A0AA39JZW8_ARMTA|nr:uncharacterized protein EV420DRAFT_1562331 [Desarmillaria tabescens]KAK0450549.1 hypothetical protein EV420DRAFT_1562331 [Desarmillaria tabescens]
MAWELYPCFLGDPATMLRIGSALRCLRAVRPSSASYTTAAAPASLHRTVRVENLPSGYDVGSIIQAIKANPAEAVVPSKDHLLVKFFDEYTAKRCVEASNGVQNLSLKIDESTSAPLDDATISKIVKFNLTRTVRLSDIPKGLSEYDLKQTLSKYEGVDVRFNLAETEADIHFLDIHQVADAYSALKATGATPTHIQVIPDDYIFPEWYTPEGPEATQAVVFSEFPSPEIRNDCYRLVLDMNSNTVPFITTVFAGRKGIKSFFPTTALAKQFVEECKPKTDAFGVKVAFESTVRTLKASSITAVSLGATRVVSLPVTVQPSKFGRLQNFFRIYGDVAQWGISSSDGRLLVAYYKLMGAASLISAYSQGFKHKVPPEIEGVTPTFYRGNRS